ncbi:tyrosine-protein phosphatase [Dactylosporangium sp. NPDC000244]|uniref:tyrosine-protein phosphatase n=1 Tax=Dactylosporangium sp. NPDC000244 TaxID=3154365 RepID=UPI003320DAFA
MRLHWPDCRNVRDLGGLPAAEGRTVRERALVRADSLNRLTAEGVAALRAYGDLDAYLLAHGRTGRQLDALRARPVG